MYKQSTETYKHVQKTQTVFETIWILQSQKHAESSKHAETAQYKHMRMHMRLYISLSLSLSLSLSRRIPNASRQPARPVTRSDRFAFECVLILIQKWTWSSRGIPGRSCLWVDIDFTTDMDLEGQWHYWTDLRMILYRFKYRNGPGAPEPHVHVHMHVFVCVFVCVFVHVHVNVHVFLC